MTQPRLRLLATVAAFFALAIAFLALSEGFYIGHLATPAGIADYHFGSESMLSHGGPHYASAEAYVRAQWVQGFTALGVGVLCAYFSFAATRHGGRVLNTWALRVPAYAWLGGGILILAIIAIDRISPGMTFTPGDAPVEAPKAFGQAGLWLLCGSVFLIVGLWLWRRYALILRDAG